MSPKTATSKTPLPEGWEKFGHATRINFAQRAVENARSVIAHWELQIAQTERALASRIGLATAEAVSATRDWLVRTRAEVEKMKRDLARRESLLARVIEEEANDPQLALL